MDKNIVINNNEFRIRNMNAIEVFAMRSQINFDDFESSLKFCKTILENMEVKALDKWLPVKEKNMEVYYPNDIENDFETIPKLLNFFSEYMQSVFIKSNKFKDETK